jgi:copper(I)-binding protein
MNTIRTFGLLPLLGLAIACANGDPRLGEDSPRVAIERAIVVEETTAGSETAAYAVFVNTGPATSIVEAECTCADALELHLVKRDGSNPGMTNSWPLALAANSRTEIAPPGVPRHMMLMGIKAPIKAGEKVTLRFKLEDGRWIDESFVAVPNSTEAWRAFEDAAIR